MKVSVTIDRRDLIKINFYLWPRISWNWFYVALIFLIITVPNAILGLKEDAILLTLSTALPIAVAAAILIPAFTFIFCLGINLLNASEKTGLGAHDYEISTEGLHEETTLNSEFSKWVSFSKVYKWEKYIILKKHWAALHIFPAREFASKAEFEKFYKEIVKYVNM